MLSTQQSRQRKHAVLVGTREGKSSKGKEQALAILYDEVFMQPWFVPKDVYLAIRRIIPNIHLMKMRHYFDDYGCLKCGETETIYGSSGLCHACNVVVRSRIMASLKKRLKKMHVKWEETVSDHFFDQMNLAQLILRGTSTENRRSPSNKDRL
ncbi:MAG TPA: hypothetical protein VKP61_17200 [Candidatus Acidoferrum sp.]|nr:hypothetical protein [Candidatus Acidoferrum sp.]